MPCHGYKKVVALGGKRQSVNTPVISLETRLYAGYTELDYTAIATREEKTWLFLDIVSPLLRYSAFAATRQL